MAAISTATLVSLAISATLSIVTRLLAPQRSAPSFGGSLPRVKDPGTQVTLRNAAEPHQIVFGRRRVKGNIVFAHMTENNTWFNLVVEWAGHECDSFEALYFNDEEVPVDPATGGVSGRYTGHVFCYDHLGSADQTYDPVLVGVAPDKWTGAHRGRGIAYSVIRLQWNPTIFHSGFPNMWRVVKGLKVYDPRSGLTAWSDNASLCQAAWLANAKYGRAIPYGGPGTPSGGIDTDALSAAANICDETVTLLNGGTEKRYTCNAVLESDKEFGDNLDALLTASAGSCALVGGAWVIDAAAWEAPTLTLDESHFREPFSVQNGLGNADAFNASKGKFANPDKLWQLDDFPAITSASYESEDGGERIFKDVELKCTTSPTMAQRLARIDLRRARQPITFTAKLKLIGLRLRPGVVAAIDNDFLGWSAKPFKVERMKLVIGFAPSSGQGGAGEGSQPGIIGVDVDFRETAEAIYAWSASSDEQVMDPAPNTQLPDPFTVLPPSNLTVVEDLYSTREGGGAKARVTLAWDASPDAFVVNGGGYRVRWRLEGETAWNTAVTAATTAEIRDFEPGTWEFQVEAQNFAGRYSDPIAKTQPIAGLAAVPAAPTGLTVNASGGLAVARWTRSSDLDVRQGGSIVFRHSALLTGATWADGVTISEPLDGSSTIAVLPLKAGTYMAKFVDSTGNWSDLATYVQRQASVHQFTALADGSVVEDPGFAGVKTACVAAGGVLTLDDSGAFDDVVDVDALVNFDYTEGVSSSGSYAFAAPIDLGSVKRCRLTVGIESQVVDVYDDFDSRTGEVDDWPSWDGDIDGDEADAVVMVRATQDDPAATPTWTGWERLDSADFEARGFELRLDLMSNDPSYSIDVTALSAVAEGV